MLADDASIVELLAAAVGGGSGRLEAVADRYQHDPDVRLLVARLDGRSVGVAGYVVGESMVTVLHIATAPSLRRKGIGAQLLDAVGKATGYRLPLVAETDQASVGFYRSTGFAIASLGERYPGVERFTVTRANPQAALRIDVEGARLQVPTDEQVELLARRAAQPGSILPEGEEHFVKWLEGLAPAQIERDRIARMRSNRDLTMRPGWTLDLAVLVDGEPVGLQSVSGFDRWPARRIVGTTSWLVRSHQGRGLGTRCRAAVLELVFARLGAESAKSWVLDDNRASVAVSTKLGYRRTSTEQFTEHGRVLTEHVYQLDAGDWLSSGARRGIAPVVTGAGGLVTLLST